MCSFLTSQCDLQAFQPRQSLWKLIEEFAPENERSEIKEILGEDIIDETNDLHREVDMLLEIWQECRDNNDKKNKEILKSSNFQRLPEPPQMRSNLKKEIQLFIKALKQKNVEYGMSSDSFSLSKREKSIVEYAFGEGGLSNKELDHQERRPQTSSLENGRVTPARPASSGSESRSSSALSDVMDSFQDQLNVGSFDHLANRLRNILLDEKDGLIEDVAFLQNTLFEESQFTCPEQVGPEPSLQELKDLGIKLEKEMTKKGTPTPTFRKPSHSSPPRRPQRNRKIFRSSSSPAGVGNEREKTIIGTDCESDIERQQLVSSHSKQDSLSPSPPTSAVSRRPGSVSRFRKLIHDSRT